jgi:hypothetical protein
MDGRLVLTVPLLNVSGTAMIVATLRQAWDTYEASERRNIGIFILGLMFYKFGLEIVSTLY